MLQNGSAILEGQRIEWSLERSVTLKPFYTLILPVYISWLWTFLQPEPG